MSFKKICFYSFNFILLFCVFNISAQDFSGPEITSLTLSPTNVDLSTGSVTVTASIQVSDTTGVDLSQLNIPYFTGGTPGIVSGYRTFTRWSLISGDKYNGSYEATLELIPSKVPPDSYNLSSSYFYDENGFYSSTSSASILTVQNSTGDFSGPEITSLTLSPTNVDLSTGSVTVTASIQVSDTTGVDLSQLNIPYFTGGTPGIVSGYRTFTRWSLISGDKYNGSYEATLELIPSKVPPDSYNLSSSYFYDENGFYSSTSSASILTVQNQYNVSPTVILTDTDSDNIVSNSDVVTITATFSKSMSATPTLSLTGIISDAQMSATASDSIWTYTWTVSGSTVSSTTATVSGTDLSGNAYAGTDSLTFTILSKSFTKTESGSFLKVLKTANGKYLASKLSDNNASSGYNFIYESTDLQNWSQLSLSFDTSVSRGSWYGFHKDANSVLYLATKDNGVYKSSDGSSWANTISGDIGGTGAIDITSTSSYTFLLMTGNIRGIYSSNDQTNWTKIKSDGLDMADLAVGNDNTVYSITTTKKLFESQNANTTTTNVVWSENTIAAFNSKTVVVENLNDKIHLINDEGKVYRNDSGTWNNISTIPFTTTEQAYLNQLIQTSSSDFWLGTVYNGVWYSSDAGANWINYSSVYSGTYQGIFFEGEVVVITTTEGIYTHGSVSNNYNMTVYEKFDYGELEVLEGKNGGSGWDGSWINSTSSSINKHYIMSASTYSSGGDEYKIDNRSSMTYPGLSVTGNYVGDDANQTDVTKSDYRKTYKKLGSNVYIQFLVQFNNYADADNSNAKNNYFILKEGNSEKLVIKRKNGRIYMAKTTSSSASGDLFDTGVDLKGSSAAQLVIVHIGDSKTKIWIDPNLSTFNYNSPPVEDANLSYTFEFDQINLQSQAKYLYGGPTLFDEIYVYEINNNLSPTVILSDSDSDNLVSNSDVVTLTATFSESMTATPTLSLTGIVSDAEMTATASASIWTYTWTVSTTVTSTTATVSGTNLVGNAYAGTDSLTFSIDNLGLTVVLSNNSLNNRVSNTQSVTLYATFSEELDITPTISLSGITTDAAMSNGNTIVLKPNNGWTSSSGSFQDFNGSSGSHPYLAEDLVIFSYLDNASIYKNFTISSGTVSVVVKLDYKKSYSEDTGQVKLYYYDANSTLLSTDASAVLTGTSDFQNLNFQSSVPSGAVVVRLELIQINESEFWAGNYGIRYRDLEITGVDEGTVYGGNDTWSYTWTVSTTATSTTATVSATDNAGNSYTGSESMTFVIDNERPYAVSTTLSNNLKVGYISATDTNTLTITFNEEINASTFTASDVTILPSGYFSISEHTSSDNIIFIGYLNVLSNYAGVVTLTLNENSLEDLAGNANTVSSVSFISDYTVPTVTLTDTDSDNLVSNSEVVTLTATFSESMSATPTLSLTGIVSDAEMTATASDSIWTYTWTVSGSTVTSTTATVSGTDLAGNAYSGTDSITFTIDNSNPTLVSFTDSDTDNYVNDYTNVTLSATFSESMASSPTIKIDNGTNVILVNSASMTVSSSTSSATWTYFWDVPGGSDGTYFATVSGTDLSGNAYTGTESITFVVDNTAPLIQSVTVTNTNSKVLLTYNEPVQLYDPSYFASNFSVTKTGGTATVSYTGYSFSTTDSNTVILNIIVTGEPTGDELLEVGPVGASTLIDKAGNYAMDYSDSNQTSNTVYLTNTPPKFASISVSSNNTSITIAFSEGVTADTSGTELSKTDFTLAVSGGAAVLASATPIALSKTDSKTYVLTTSYSVPSNGSEILTVTPISSAVFDSKGTQINLSSAQSNTVQLNDQAGPFITGATLDSQNRYVDFTFSEGVYATASPTSAVTSSSFTLSQSSGPSYGMTISSITTAGGGVLSGGETTLRFNLESAVKPTGQEVFAITATDSSSVVDASGNSMTVSQTNNTFQLKPPTSGGVSPKKSTISAAPAQMIGNGINTAVITVQAKDSLGQNFLEGGYQITLFGPNGDLTTTDNQNGTYSASYTPEAITQDFQELTFGFRVADTNGTPTALLQLYLDEDGDGVYNINDACLGTEAGLEVDATGCALNQLDSDNDGVFDDLDECPDTPEQELNNVQGTPTYGELIPTVVDEKGCGASQRDTDSDGIVDTEDNCIETANADQADTDGDGIGDVCDTDNPLPEITTTEIKFVQLPQNGTTVGKIEATDPDGETLTFTQSGDNFTGVLSIASDGSITVSSGALLTFDSTYNGASLGFTVSDGKNDVPGSVKILIEDVPRPPEISIITLEISEDAEVGTIVGFVEAKDPMGGQIVSISLQGDGFIELKDGVLKTTQELDYEENTIHPFTITAQASDRSDGPGLTGSKSESLRVSDIPNATYTGRFFISIFNVEDETLGAKVDHRRYFNPYNKNVGKWKIKKRVAGGADADKFTVKTRSKTEQKNGDPIEDENEDYLDFITPPDYENPGDANGDNIYEVEVEYVNTDDGAPEVPIVVTQTNIQVPEGSTTTIELQSQPVLPTDDNDGDGVPDIIDNSPLVANADQSDEDGDGVGDVTDDSDHDGVWNPFDTCPDTPLGELVDLDGCLIYYLPASNFSISKTEKCIGENSITIDVIDATLDYNVTVSGATNATEVFTGSSWSLENLSAGEYTLCIGVEGVNPSEFERCFEVTIEESDPLLVSSFYSKENQNVTFDLSGGSAYQITHNGKTIQTSSSKHTVQLDKGINNISISTGIECQGLFEKTYLNSYEVKYAPNPFKEELQLFIGGKDNLVEIGVYASNGQLIDYQTVSLSFGMRNYSLNTSSYKQGVYIIKVKGQTLDQSIQVIKE